MEEALPPQKAILLLQGIQHRQALPEHHRVGKEGSEGAPAGDAKPNEGTKPELPKYAFPTLPWEKRESEDYQKYVYKHQKLDDIADNYVELSKKLERSLQVPGKDADEKDIKAFLSSWVSQRRLRNTTLRSRESTRMHCPRIWLTASARISMMQGSPRHRHRRCTTCLPGTTYRAWLLYKTSRSRQRRPSMHALLRHWTRPTR